VPGHGALGAAAASSCAYAVVAVLLVARFTREPGFSWRTLLLVQRSDWELARDLVRPRRAPADAAGGPSLGTGA
jgi:Na+-driven multidrug efflux pump